MEKKRYEEIVERHKAKENKIRNMLVSFFIGGFVGIIAVFLTDLYSFIFSSTSSFASILMIVTLIFIGCLFTALGFFDKWVNFARCGLIIPITGFAHSMMSAALEYKKEGPIYGVGSNMFRLAGSVIVYGVVSASIFGAVRYLLFGGNV